MRAQPKLYVEVEPMSDTRWARVERELFTKLDARPLRDLATVRGPTGVKRTVWAAASLAAVAAGVFAIVHPGHAVHWDDRLRLATTDSTSQFTVGESSLTVAPKSLVLVSGDDEHGTDVVLDRGKVTCEVAPRRGRPSFRLDAGEVRIRVVGTKFTVSRAENETAVDVEEGAVEVTSRGMVTVVRKGEHWPPAPAVVHTAVAPPETAAPADTPATSSRPVRPPRHRHSAATADPTPEAVPDDPSPPETTSISAPSTQSAFEAATRSERTDPDAAAAAYRKIAASGSAWAPNALFALGRLEADRGHRAEATRLIKAYLAAYPRGINVDDARELLRRLR